MGRQAIREGAVVKLILDEEDDSVTDGMMAYNGEELVIKDITPTGITLAGFKSPAGKPYWVSRDMFRVIG